MYTICFSPYTSRCYTLKFFAEIVQRRCAGNKFQLALHCETQMKLFEPALVVPIQIFLG